MKKTLAIILIAVIVMISALFIFREWLSRGEPISNKNVTFQGYGRVKISIESPVSPISVELDDERDLFTALGFSQAFAAGDRMEFLRLCTYGRLTQTFGRRYEAFDVYMKSWKFPELAGITLDSLNIRTNNNILDFIKGINLRYELYDPPSGCLWSGIKPERWEPENILAAWHLLRWSQMENWPLYFLIRYMDIYYGKHVKEQFETALGMKIHDNINIGHVRKIIELYELEREFRRITGLSQVLDEHISSPWLIYGYSGSQNEDWIRLDVTYSGIKKSYVMHTGLPLFFAINGDGVYPVTMHSVPLNPPAEESERMTDIMPSTVDIYGSNRYFDFGIKTKLFDMNGRIFQALMNKDSVTKQQMIHFSYGKCTPMDHESDSVVYIQSDTEKEVNKEIVKILRDTGFAAPFLEQPDPILLSLFKVRLINRVYGDDLGVIHPAFAQWPAEFQPIFHRHLQIILKNPYSAWWDNKETIDTSENMFDVIRKVFNEFNQVSNHNIKSEIQALEQPGHPLSRYHLFTGSWQYYSKELTAPLLIKSHKGQYFYDRFYFTP